ncbi:MULTISPECIES: heme o synthase [unclassified Acinetobacter]|uniref:heme o synthase n=1 Tax=unclassified Acinetobacter TaxID=196816 RepID=UPI0035B9500B
MLRQYLFLTKPGILFGNFVTTLGGILLAAQGVTHLSTILITLLATTLVVACGCVLNNIIDQDIDQKMQRTASRALVKKIISPTQAYIFAVILGVVGLSLLYFLINLLAFAFALLGLFVYVVLYSLWTKRTTIHQTVIGSISGACPPAIGYCAISNQFDAAGLILFIGYALWQMPHSWGIAIFRLSDYAQADIPILPVARSVQRTKLESLVYVILFTLCMNGLFLIGHNNWIYLLILNILCIYWIVLSIQGFKAENDQLWAKKYFLYSVKVITILSISFIFTTTTPDVIWQW